MSYKLSYVLEVNEEKRIIADERKNELFQGDKRLEECLYVVNGITFIANDIQIFYTMSEVVKYMTEHHPTIRGWKQRTMAKYSSETYIKNGFKLEFIKTVKERKTPEGLKKYKPQEIKVKNNITFYELKKRPRQKEYKFKADSWEVYKHVLEYIQPIQNIRNKAILVKLEIRIEVNEYKLDENGNQIKDARGNIETIKVKKLKDVTIPYTFYNNLQNRIFDQLKKFGDRYTFEELELVNIQIRTKNLIPAIQQIIYKNTNGNYDKNINKYLILDELKKNKNIYEDELFEEIKNYKYIISPKTYNKCLLSCVIMAVYNKEDIKQELHNKKIALKKDFKYNMEDCKIIIDFFNNEFKNMNFIINIYFISDEIHNYKCENKDNIDKTNKIINILINRNHAHLLIKDNEEFKLIDESQHEKEVINKELIKKPLNKNSNYAISTFNILLDNNNEIIKINVYTELQNYYEFTNINDFLLYIKNNENNTVFYIHNGKSKFYLLLKHILKEDELSIINFLEDDNKILNIELKNKNKKMISFRDSMNFLNNYNIYGYIKDFEIKEYKENNIFKNDTKYLYDILNKVNNILIDNFKLTILDSLTSSSLSRKIFLNKYYEENIYKISSSMEHKFRKYYHGGRNEIFKIGCINDNIYHYDFTSFYPSIMEKNNFPINKMNIIKIEEQNKKTFNKDWFGLVKCRIRHINKNKRPFHAIHDEEKNIIYPYIDNFIKIILTTEEIKYSIDNNLGYEYEFIKVYNYVEKKNIFTNFINNLFSLKQKSETTNNKSLREISKTIINSSYGYWAFNTSEKEQVVINSNEIKNKKNKSEEYIKNKIDNNKNQYEYAFINSQKLIDHTEIGKYDIYKIKDELSFNCNNIIISMFISSYSRIRLYDLMIDIERKKGKVFYIDTDAIMTNINLNNDKDIKKKYIMKNKANLGELMNEYQKELKKILLKDNVSLKNVEKYIKTLSDNECYFKNLIFISLKFYYYEIEFNYNDKIYKKAIIKTRGINNNICYNKLIIDDDNKKVSLMEESINGEYKLNKEIFIKLSEGYKLCYDVNEKRMNMKEIINNTDIHNVHYNKNICMMYDKGTINNNNDIVPLII